MLKPYLRGGKDITRYHEAWASNKSTIVEHWGKLGMRDQQQKHRLITQLRLIHGRTVL